MRRAILLALGLALVAGTAGAEDFIRYTAPQPLLADGTLTYGLLGPAAGVNIYNVGGPGSTNYEVARLYWTGNVFTISTAQGGTGTIRSINLAPGNGSLLATGIYPADDLFPLGGTANRWTAVYVSRSIQGSKSKTLTDSAAATAYATIAVPTNGQIAGELIWTATSSASAVRFVANGSIRFWGTDEGGTPVCGINKIGTDGEGHSSGANTLVCTWTNVVATTNCALSVTCTNNVGGVDPITINGRLDMPTTATVTFN